MIELEGSLVAARFNGYVYEGLHSGFHQRGPFEFHILADCRFVNDQQLQDRDAMYYGENWAPLGKVYLPVGPTVIHLTHLMDRK